MDGFILKGLTWADFGGQKTENEERKARFPMEAACEREILLGSDLLGFTRILPGLGWIAALKR